MWKYCLIVALLSTLHMGCANTNKVARAFGLTKEQQAELNEQCKYEDCFCEERIEIVVADPYGAGPYRTYLEQDCPKAMLKRGPRMTEEYVE